MMRPTRPFSIGLFAGTTGAFLACIFLGHAAVRFSKPDRFQRFYQNICLDGSFLPPFAMLEQIVDSRYSPGQVLVIVGGDSVMHGIGQPDERLWTRRLSDKLGPGYAVVNLAMRGSNASEGAELVVESQLRKGRPVIYVADSRAGGAPLPYEGHYEYLYWQARAEGALYPSQEHEARLQDWLHNIGAKQLAGVREIRLGALLEPWLRCQSLWHHVSYRHVCTVWNTPALPTWWAPKSVGHDPEPYPRSLTERYGGSPDAEMSVVRGYSERIMAKTADGSWTMPVQEREGMRRSLRAAFSRPVREHMIMLLATYSPHYVRLLTDDENMRDIAAVRESADIWREEGVQAVTLKEELSENDYADRVHLSPEGGDKLARLMADLIVARTAKQEVKP